MARTKVETPSVASIADWHGVDAALGEIGRLQQRITAEEAAYNEKEKVARAKITTAHAAPRKRIAELEVGMKVFCDQHRKDFGKDKTKKLTNGEVSYRIGQLKTTMLKKVTLKGAVELAIAAGGTIRKLFVRMVPELNRDALIDNHTQWTESKGKKGINPKDVEAAICVAVTQDETFGYNIKLAIKN